MRKPWGRWDDKSGVACPVCHHNSCDWVPERAGVAPETGQALFAEMKKAIQ